MLKLILLVFLITGCSLGSFLVGKLDSYLAMKTADRLHLYTKQETQLELDIEALFNRVKPQMKIIHHNLKEINDQKKLHVSKDQLNRVKLAFKPMFNDMALLLAKYVGQMTEKQSTKFLNDLKKRNEKAKKKLTIKRSIKKVPPKFEEFFGELTEEQHDLIKNQIQPFFNWKEQRYRTNIKMHNDLSAIGFGNDRAELVKKSYQKVIQGTFVNIDEGNLDKIVDLINQLLATLKKKQIEHLKDKLELSIEIIDKFIQTKY